MLSTGTGHGIAVARTDTITRHEWLAERRHGIGGSDAAAVCGLDRWRSPFEVWLDKTGTFIDDTAATEAMRWGQLLEPVIAGQLDGVDIVEVPWMLAHPSHPWMLADVDRVAFDTADVERLDPGVVEVKTTSLRNAPAWEEGPPAPVICQGMHYLAVTGHRWLLAAALIGGQRLVTHRVERDDELIDDLLTIEARFWADVEAKRPPEPDGSKATTALLGRLYEVEPDRVEVVELAEVDATLAALASAKERERSAAEDRATAENALKVRMGSAELLVDTDNRPIARWPAITASRVNVERLRAEYPDVAAAVTETATHRRFTTPRRS
jgi:putative phage-type endonuclease